MDIQTILLIVTTAINLGWGLLIFIKGRSKKPNLIFSSVVFSVVLWSVSMTGYRLSTANTLDWCRVLYVAAILIPLSFLYFNFAFPEGRKTNKYFLVLISVPALVLILLTVFSNTIIADAFQVKNTENKIIFGSLYIFYVLYIIGYFSWSFIILMVNQKKYSGIVRMQSRYILIGAGSASTVAMTTNLLLPWFDIFIVNWLGQVATFLWVSFTSYAMIRYRLMDLRVIIRKAVIYIFSAGFVYGMFYLIAWLYNKIFGGIYTNGAYILGLIIAPLFVGLFVWVNNKIRGFANKYLFFDLYTHQETIEKLTDELNNSIDLDKIVDSISNSIKNAMQLDRAGILLIDQNEGTIRYKIAKVIGFNENNGISLVQDNFLTQYLEKTQKPLVRDELQMISRDSNNIAHKQNFNQLAENMKHIEASLCLPMIISNKLIGIIVLGSKISGDAYTSDDLNLLSTLSKQVTIAVDNARLYKEVQDFSKTLQQKVDEQTKEIRDQKDKIEKAFEVEKKAHDLEKHANEELKHLDENKTDFMLITQHHLRTPLSVNAGFLDLMLNGTFGKIPVKQKDVVLRLRESTQKEIDVVNELLDVSSYQIGKEVIHFHPIDFDALMEETLKDLTAEAEAKGIYLKYEKKGEMPKVPADRMKLKLVITNVIDNCIKYTAKGGVTVAMEIKNEKLLISVIDTGIGLSNEVIQNLFKQSFHRGEQAKKMFAVGKGLGLFLSGKIIEGHNGRIWAESRGAGIGSAFYIELPLNQDQSTDQQIKVENNVSANLNSK